MRKVILLIILIFTLLSGCKKDGIFPKELPYVGLEVEWIPPKSFIMVGETLEPCDRGFIISGRKGAGVGDADAIVLPYDIQGVGNFTKEITLSSGIKVYIKAWANRGKLEYTSYSKERSFETW